MHPTARPRVSVVIPVKDDATLLDGCLASLREQTWPPDEIVVVDNGSQDASAVVGRRGGARVVPCARPGIPAASAAGLDAATGDVLLRLDADCRAPADWIERMTAALAAPHVGAATGGARFESTPAWPGRWAARGYLGAYTLVCGAALGHRPLFGSNMAVRAEVWRALRERVRTDDPEVHDDLDLSFPLGERYRIVRVRGAAMRISARPFADPRAFGRRIRRGMRTVLLRWPHDLPPIRVTRIGMRRLRRARASAAASTPRRYEVGRASWAVTSEELTWRRICPRETG
jgi:glycosyltransferase involved in cell wall biosynthesis